MYDPSYPEIDHSSFNKCNWSEFYRDAKEAIIMNAPEPQGKEVDICMFVDRDHAGASGLLIYMNTALVQWFSKKQSIVKTSVFGAEFVTINHCIDALRGLRYKLRIMGSPISGPSYIYEGNVSVIHNTSCPELVLG